ncbi:GNAT family N-acetyltransferase [Actinoalloteichus fjordicus]|nr:GNAT family N-acetyltransferase [Actinoalloteichus fjordicus]
MAAQLITERLTLRPFAVSDIDVYRALVAERGHGLPTAEDVHGRIAEQLAEAARSGIRLYALRRRAEGDVVGYCGLIVGRATRAEPEIGYELFRHAQGRGEAAEAARAVLAAAVTTGRRRLWATVRTGNTASLRVLDKLGFERDHTSTDRKGELIWLTRGLR